jgi:uncharacterized protein
MPHRFAELTFTAAVEAAQTHYGVRYDNQRLLESAGPNDRLGERERSFIGRRDSFYLSTVSQTGWPYVQHRGGPPGFLKVLDDKRLAFADFRGNRQYISVGNLAHDDRAALFLMDYHMRMHDVADADADLIELLRPYPYRASMERVAILEIEAFDWNCSQHITPRYTEAHLREATASLHQRIAELEALLATRP